MPDMQRHENRDAPSTALTETIESQPVLTHVAQQRQIEARGTGAT
jgi:hypothetical protein